jgi:hypothetical protein
MTTPSFCLVSALALAVIDRTRQDKTGQGNGRHAERARETDEPIYVKYYTSTIVSLSGDLGK